MYPHLNFVQKMKPLIYSFFLLLLSNPIFAQVKELYVQQDKLWSAIVNNRADDVIALLKQGVKINELSYLNNYPFLEAAKRSNADMIKLLLANGADVNLENNYKQNALHICVMNPKAVEVAAAILKGQPNIDHVDQFGRTPFAEAVSEGKLDVAKLFLEKGADINFQHPKTGASVLVWEARKENVKIIEFLLKNGADIHLPDREGVTAIYEAAVSLEIENIHVLMKNGADPFRKAGKNNAITNALNAEKWEVLKAILSHVEDINFKLDIGYGLVHDAVINEKIELLKIMIELGADLNQKNQYGSTPLSLATYNGNQEMIRLLEANGAQK